MKFFLISMLLLVLAGLGAEACPCQTPLSTNFVKFCDNELAIKGRVININLNPNSMPAGVIKYRVYAQGFMGQISKLSVYTYATTTNCGFGSLQLQSTYLFSMSRNPSFDDHWWLSTCTSWVQHWSTLTTAQKQDVCTDWPGAGPESCCQAAGTC